MTAKNGPRGEIHATGGNGEAVVIRVYWKRGSTYLSLNGHEHLVHTSNLRRANGFVMEAVLVYHVSDAVYVPR